jgi:predicted nucleotide-binding protein
MAAGKKRSKQHEMNKPKRIYVSQTDVPSLSLEQALRVPQAITDEYGSNSVRPLDVARALKVQPTSGPFRTLCGAAIAYGLTEGGYNAAEIKITQLGKRIVRPTAEGDDLVARREAVLQPRVMREFLQRYDGSKFPRDDIAEHVLETLGVPREATSRVLSTIREGAHNAGFLKDINSVSYVDLLGTTPNAQANATSVESEAADIEPPQITADAATPTLRDAVASRAETQATFAATNINTRLKRVFVTHGKNRALVPQLKELLAFGQFEPVVSVERESVSKPVPDKVMDDMRSCGAAIIHVDAEREVLTQEGQRSVELNGNVLIEIGAAMALFGRRFILLVQQGISLPSNLNGLYEVRYKGEQLDGDATLRLLKAFNEFKTYPIVTP